jgi:hypothetical protein
MATFRPPHGLPDSMDSNAIGHAQQQLVNPIANSGIKVRNEGAFGLAGHEYIFGMSICGGIFEMGGLGRYRAC